MTENAERCAKCGHGEHSHALKHMAGLGRCMAVGMSDGELNPCGCREFRPAPVSDPAPAQEIPWEYQPSREHDLDALEEEFRARLYPDAPAQEKGEEWSG